MKISDTYVIRFFLKNILFDYFCSRCFIIPHFLLINNNNNVCNKNNFFCHIPMYYFPKVPFYYTYLNLYIKFNNNDMN